MNKRLISIFSVVLSFALIAGCTVSVANDTNSTTVQQNSMQSDNMSVATSTTDSSASTTVPISCPNNTTTTAGSTVTNKPATTKTVTTTKPAPSVSHLTPLSTASYYGLSQLGKLPNGNNMKTVYAQLVTAVEQSQPTTQVEVPVTKDELLKVFYYYRADYPQHFWCGNSIRYTTIDNKVADFTLTYTMSGDALRTAKTKFDKAVTALLQKASSGRNEYERELIIHDELAKNTTYQMTNHAYTAYGALVEKKAVCEGYSRAFQYVLYQAGIPCLFVVGTSVNPSTGKPESHGWNIAKIDGHYYHVDTTWDDTDNAEVPVMYPYFNVTTAQISEDHTINQKDNYPLPNCTATAANYHVKNGTRLSAYSVQTVADVLKRSQNGAHFYAVNGSSHFTAWVAENHRAIATAMGIVSGSRRSTFTLGKEVVLRIVPQ